MSPMPMAEMMGFHERPTEYGPLLTFAATDQDRAAGEVPLDLLIVGSEIADRTGLPVDVFLAEVGHLDLPAAWCMRIDHGDEVPPCGS